MCLVRGKASNEEAPVEEGWQGLGAAWPGGEHNRRVGEHLAINELSDISTLLLTEFVIPHQEEQYLGVVEWG